MCGGVVTRGASNDADIRLGLGPVIEDDRALSLNEPALSESALQRLRHEKHRRPMRAVLWLLDEQQTVEQLDRVVLVEEAVVDQPPVLVAGPPMQTGPLRLLHGVSYADAIRGLHQASMYPDEYTKCAGRGHRRSLGRFRGNVGASP